MSFFLPGGIVGALGGIALVGSFIVFLMQKPGLVWGTFFALLLIAGLIGTIRIALWRVRSTKNAHSIYSAQDQEGFYASQYNKHLVGKTGKAITDLRPAGHIEVDGEQYQAVSQSAFIQQGLAIEVIGGEGSRLIVKTNLG